MTQHLLDEQTEDDRQIMRRLFTVVGVFMIGTAVMAVTVTLIMG